MFVAAEVLALASNPIRLDLVGAVGIELLRALKTRKLFIVRSCKREKNRKNAEPRYTRGTQPDSDFAYMDGLRRRPKFDPLLRRLLTALIRTCRSERKARKSQQLVTDGDKLLTPFE